MFILAGTSLNAQEQTKELHKEFKTNKSTELRIDSKFCDLTVNNWDKDQAVFDVTITAKNSNESKAKKLLKAIEVKIKQDGNEIIVKTVLDDDFGKGILGVAKVFTITIVANVPSYINLDMETKFGSTKIGSFSGYAEIKSSFGSMEIEELSGSEINISVNHGDFGIGKIADAEIEMNFGSMRIHEANNLEIEINQGEVKIGTVKNLSAEVKMGSFKVDLVDSSFESIDIETDMGNVVLGIDKNAGFSIEAEMKMGNIDIPKSIGKVVKSKHGMSSSVSAEYGNGKSTINLEGNLGNIEVKLK